MAIDPAALATEIQTDPAGLGYAARVASGSDSGVAALLNDRSGGYYASQPVPTYLLLQWCQYRGIRERIEAAANDPTSAAYNNALAVRDLWWGSGATIPIDLHAPVFLASLNALSGVNVTVRGESKPVIEPNVAAQGQAPTPGSVADLQTWGLTPCSRAESLWGYGASVSHVDVARALRG